MKQLARPRGRLRLLPGGDQRARPGPCRGTLRLPQTRQADSYFCYYSQYLPTIVGKLTAFDLGDGCSPLVSSTAGALEEMRATSTRSCRPGLPDLGQEETREALTRGRRLSGRRGRGLARTLRPDGGSEAEPRRGRRPARAAPRPAVRGLRPGPEPVPAAHAREARRFGVLAGGARASEAFPPPTRGSTRSGCTGTTGSSSSAPRSTAASDGNLYPVFLTCFRCSPDSFLMSYVKDIVTHFGKPFLFLQLDAHASDVGYTTRIEAALQSFRNHRDAARRPGTRPPVEPARRRATTAHGGRHGAGALPRPAHQPVLGGLFHPRAGTTLSSSTPTTRR